MTMQIVSHRRYGMGQVVEAGTSLTMVRFAHDTIVVPTSTLRPVKAS